MSYIKSGGENQYLAGNYLWKNLSSPGIKAKQKCHKQSNVNKTITK